MTAAARHPDMLRRSLAERVAARLPPLLLAAERVAAAAAQGAHGRRRAGIGDAFWQFRRHQPGDGASAVDWRRSARADALFVRENEWEATQSLYLWRDGSGSMNWRSAEASPTKLERAEIVLLALAVLATRAGERVAPLGAGTPPLGGSFAVERLAALFGDARSAATMRLDGPPPPRFAQAVLIGDFLDDFDRLETQVRALGERGVRGCLIQILDPAEEDLPYAGRVRLSGLEGEAPLLLPRVEDLRDAYRARLADRRDRLHGLARAAGWVFIRHRTDRSPQTALLAAWAALAGRGEQVAGAAR